MNNSMNLNSIIKLKTKTESVTETKYTHKKTAKKKKNRETHLLDKL